MIGCVVVFFGLGLREEDFFDDARRRRCLRDGVEAIRRRVRGVEVIQELPTVCAAAVEGAPDAISALKAFLDTSGVGSYEDDSAEAPLTRPARTV